MKNLYKKIGAVALVGIVLAGGIGVSGIRANANEVRKKSDLERYAEMIYNSHLPKDSYFIHEVALKELLNDDEDERVKKQIEEIKEACKGKNLEPIFLSSEFSENKEDKRGVDAFLSGIEKYIKDKDGGDRLFNEPELYFDDADDLQRYLQEKSEQIESGIFKLQVGNVQGIFRGRSGKIE